MNEPPSGSITFSSVGVMVASVAAGFCSDWRDRVSDVCTDGSFSYSCRSRGNTEGRTPGRVFVHTIRLSHLWCPEEFHGVRDSHAAVLCDQQCNLKNVCAGDCSKFWRFIFGHVLQLFRTDRRRWLNVFVTLMSPQLTEKLGYSRSPKSWRLKEYVSLSVLWVDLQQSSTLVWIFLAQTELDIDS